ncbi:hypothetical protein ACLOJK_034944 [Asimina triloba]
MPLEDEVAAVMGCSPDLKGTLIGGEGDGVWSARRKMLSSTPADAVRSGLRSRRIYNHIVVINLLNDSDQPIRASPVVGSMAATSGKMELVLSP